MSGMEYVCVQCQQSGHLTVTERTAMVRTAPVRVIEIDTQPTITTVSDPEWVIEPVSTELSCANCNYTYTGTDWPIQVIPPEQNL